MTSARGTIGAEAESIDCMKIVALSIKSDEAVAVLIATQRAKQRTRNFILDYDVVRDGGSG